MQIDKRVDFMRTYCKTKCGSVVYCVKSSYDDDDDAQFEQSLLTYVKKEELSTMKRDTRSLYRYPLDTSRTTAAVHTQASLLDQLACCLLCNYSTHVNCRHHQQSTASTLPFFTARAMLALQALY